MRKDNHSIVQQCEMEFVWRSEDELLLGTLTPQQQTLLNSHVEKYALQVQQHVEAKLEADPNTDIGKLQRRATKKICAAAAKALAAVASTGPAASPATSTPALTPKPTLALTPTSTSRTDSFDTTTRPSAVTSSLPVASTDISEDDPYACLCLELPSHSFRAQQAATNVLPTPGEWSIFTNPALPLVVDVGCGSGQWCLRAAHEERKHSDVKQQRNYLGLEIRKGLVHTACSFAKELALEGRVAFWHGNVNATYWREQIAHYPGDIILFCCQLPDPRLDKNVRRTHGRCVLTKDRILQPSFARAVVDTMSTGGAVYISSDYEEVAVEMYNTLSENPRLSCTTEVQDLRVLPETNTFLPVDNIDNNVNIVNIDDTTKTSSSRDEWLRTNPFGLPTEREVRLRSMVDGGRNVYRAAFVSLLLCLSLCLSSCIVCFYSSTHHSLLPPTHLPFPIPPKPNLTRLLTIQILRHVI